MDMFIQEISLNHHMISYSKYLLSPLKPVLKFKSTKYNYLLQPALGQNRLIKNTTYFYHHLNTRSVGVLMMFNYHLYI